MTDEATKHNQATYDQIAPVYARRRAGQERSLPDVWDAFAARLPTAASVADLGCGPALDGAAFLRAGHRVVGADLSAGMRAIAAEALAGQVTQADPRCLPLADASVDGIWC